MLLLLWFAIYARGDGIFYPPRIIELLVDFCSVLLKSGVGLGGVLYSYCALGFSWFMALLALALAPHVAP